MEKTRIYKVILLELVMVTEVEVSKICQLLQNQLDPKSQIYQKSSLQKLIPERIFLLLKPKRPLYIYKKLLPRLRFLSILIQNAISKLK